MDIYIHMRGWNVCMCGCAADMRIRGWHVCICMYMYVCGCAAALSHPSLCHAPIPQTTPPIRQTWEMLLVECLTWVAPLTECFIRYKLFGIHGCESKTYKYICVCEYIYKCVCVPQGRASRAWGLYLFIYGHVFVSEPPRL